jgi:hypothetical protein
MRKFIFLPLSPRIKNPQIIRFFESAEIFEDRSISAQTELTRKTVLMRESKSFPEGRSNPKGPLRCFRTGSLSKEFLTWLYGSFSNNVPT